MSNILTYLSQVPDKRRRQGIRYPLDKTMVLMLIGVMAGCEGYRSIARFCKSHEKLLTKAFDLKHGVPSHVSFTAIANRVDMEDLQEALNQWSLSKLEKKPGESPVIAIDGKAIKSSLKSGISNEQNFLAFVNAFCVSQQIVASSIVYENKTGSEIETVRQLIDHLGVKGAIFTLDANHDSKKR